MGKKNPKLETAWRERLSRFRRGNLTVAEFCRREGVSNPSFYQWRKRLESGRVGGVPDHVGHQAVDRRPLADRIPLSR